MNIRTAKPEDAENILRWGEEQKDINLFDPDVLLYPTTDVGCAENGKPIVYLPVQLAAVLESIVFNPAASERERSIALYKLVGAVLENAARSGVREAYFACKSEPMVKFAERLGFEALPKEWTIMRVRLPECTTQESSAT